MCIEKEYTLSYAARSQNTTIGKHTAKIKTWVDIVQKAINETQKKNYLELLAGIAKERCKISLIQART